MLFQTALTLLLIPFLYPTAASSNEIIPAISPHLTKRLFEPLLTDINCLTAYSAARSPSYFWDVLVEGVRDWECIDAYLHKEYYHGKDYFLIINTTEHRRCYRNKRIMSGLQQLWEASTKDCAGKGVMGVEIGEPDVAFCLVSL